MEKNVENEMETGIIREFIGVILMPFPRRSLCVGGFRQKGRTGKQAAAEAM